MFPFSTSKTAKLPLFRI